MKWIFLALIIGLILGAIIGVLVVQDSYQLGYERLQVAAQTLASDIQHDCQLKLDQSNNALNTCVAMGIKVVEERDLCLNNLKRAKTND